MGRSVLCDQERWIELAEAGQYRADLLARRLGLSPRQLRRLLRKLFNQSAQRWLNRLRLIRAESLLREHSAASVATLLGYKRASHFSREFKRFHGHSPRATRAAARLDTVDSGKPSHKPIHSKTARDKMCPPEISFVRNR